MDGHVLSWSPIVYVCHDAERVRRSPWIGNVRMKIVSLTARYLWWYNIIWSCRKPRMSEAKVLTNRVLVLLKPKAMLIRLWRKNFPCTWLNALKQLHSILLRSLLKWTLAMNLEISIEHFITDQFPNDSEYQRGKQFPPGDKIRIQRFVEEVKQNQSRKSQGKGKKRPLQGGVRNERLKQTTSSQIVWGRFGVRL